MDSKNNVILVNSNDDQIGVMEKLEAHQKGLLHRAISVFIFNSKKEWLLQQRAEGKYHSELLWSNAACSHPYSSESTKEAATRRLQEEMGLQAALEWSFSFQYKAVLDNNLTEHELDHVFIGYSDELPVPNPSEVSNFKYISTENLRKDIAVNPNHYSEWFKILVEKIIV